MVFARAKQVGAAPSNQKLLFCLEAWSLRGEAAARELAAEIGFEMPETLSKEDIAQLIRTIDELAPIPTSSGAP